MAMDERVGETMNGDDAALDRMLAETAVAVRPDFRAGVMARVSALAAEARPVAAGAPERVPVRSWLAAGLAALALLLAAGAAAGAAQGGPWSLLAALADFAGSSVMTGAGLLVASWRGAGLLVREALGGSVLSLIALGVIVVALDVVVLRIWRTAPARAARRRRK
jgi:hypothetical protein